MAACGTEGVASCLPLLLEALLTKDDGRCCAIPAGASREELSAGDSADLPVGLYQAAAAAGNAEAVGLLAAAGYAVSAADRPFAASRRALSRPSSWWQA